MGSQIRRRKQGNTTITQNLTKGTMTVTHRHTPRGASVGMSTSTQSGGGKTRHRTTVTRKHGEGIFSRTTKSRTHSNTRKGRGWLSKALFGDGKKKKSSSKPVSEKTVVEKVSLDESKVDTTPKDQTSTGDGSGVLAIIVLCIVGYYLIVAPMATLKVIAVIAGFMFFFAFWHVILMTFLAILGLGVIYQLFKWIFY